MNYTDVLANVDFPCMVKSQTLLSRGNQGLRERRYSSLLVAGGRVRRSGWGWQEDLALVGKGRKEGDVRTWNHPGDIRAVSADINLCKEQENSGQTSQSNFEGFDPALAKVLERWGRFGGLELPRSMKFLVRMRRSKACSLACQVRSALRVGPGVSEISAQKPVSESSIWDLGCDA